MKDETTASLGAKRRLLDGRVVGEHTRPRVCSPQKLMGETPALSHCTAIEETKRMRSGSSPHPSTIHRPSSRGYILMELALALTIFAIAVVGLTRSLNNVLEATAIVNREQAVRYSLRSFLEEVRRKAISDMGMTSTDDRLGVTFTSEVKPKPLSWNNRDLTDIYELKITAAFEAAGQAQTEEIQVLVYQTQADQEKRRTQ